MTDHLSGNVQISYPDCPFFWDIPVKSENIKQILLDNVMQVPFTKSFNKFVT